MKPRKFPFSDRPMAPGTMSRPIIITAASVALLGAAALFAGSTLDTDDKIVLNPNDRDIVAQGAEVYAAECAACHGRTLEGQPNWRVPGANGRLPAPPHDASGHTWHHSSDVLFRLTKYGVGKIIGDPNYVSDMPAYEGMLTDAEIIAVLSYIKSTWPEEIRVRHDQMDKRQ